jgi:hypothetical protein
MLSSAMRIHECFLNFSLFGAIRERNFEAQLPARFRPYFSDCLFLPEHRKQFNDE